MKPDQGGWERKSAASLTAKRIAARSNAVLKKAGLMMGGAKAEDEARVTEPPVEEYQSSE